MKQLKKGTESTTMIYEEFIKDVKNGCPFNVNLIEKTMYTKHGNKKKYYIKGGEYDEELGCKEPDALDIVNALYLEYKYSYPTENSSKQRKNYFKALDISELTDADMCLGMNRDLAKARLEAFILCASLNGSLVWDYSWGNWFYRGNDGLIILKEWVD